jgi:nicotinamidase-related amidase
MDASTSALLVIDVQKSFEKMPFWSDDGLDDFRAAQNSLIAHARTMAVSVVFVYHVSRGPFAFDSGLVAPMNWIDQQPDDPVFHKRVHNALSESGLEPWLSHRGINHLVISGIRTELCCETTTRYARDAGYEVDFILDATHTFAMQDIDGALVSPNEIKSRTALVLDRRFAAVADSASYLSQPVLHSFNRHCPRSGKPVAADSIVDYRGYRVGFCNTGCSSDFAADPAVHSMDRLYFDTLIARQSARSAYCQDNAA